MRALPRRSMPGALGSVASFLVKAGASYHLARGRSCVNRQTLQKHWLQNGCSGHAWLLPTPLRLEVPCATRLQPQQTDAVSEHPPSKQVRRSILSACLFAVLSAALAARPPSNVGCSLRQGGARQPSLDSAVAFNIGGWPWLVERIGPGP